MINANANTTSWVYDIEVYPNVAIFSFQGIEIDTNHSVNILEDNFKTFVVKKGQRMLSKLIEFINAQK